MAITGCNFVRFSRSGLHSIKRRWPRTGDQYEIRRLGLKLRFWDDRHNHPPGLLMDHEYERIKAIDSIPVYEMRVSDVIGGLENIRLVFLDPPKNWVATPVEEKPMRSVWILEAIAKKRDNWTHAQIQNFKSAVKVIRERAYTS